MIVVDTGLAASLRTLKLSGMLDTASLHTTDPADINARLAADEGAGSLLQAPYGHGC